MHLHRRRPRAAMRHPCRGVRPSFFSRHRRGKGVSQRFLLALHARGRRRDGQEIRSMLVSRHANSSTSARITDHPAHLVVRYLGTGHPGSVSTSTRGLPLPLHRHRKIHQMGRAGARAHDTGQVSRQVCPRAGMLLWGAQPHHH
jgi:hypothetical protein